MTKNDSELLARVDERTANIYKLVERIESHVKETNGKVADQEKKWQEHEKSITTNTAWRRGITAAISMIFVILLGIITCIAKIQFTA
jgi:hypothetical protein